ncbi:MAG TPA: nucleotide exchange factor GrpE [Actinomycetota bacterium]|nr:nucleotide exchange factor GrpE [Actinomycetota bacterium]
MSDQKPFDPFDPTKVRIVDKRKLTEEPADEAGAPSAEAPSAEVPSADAPEEDLARALEEARAQAASYLEDLQRLKAEFENYRKRMVREQTGMVERASASIVERLLPILDNFELALMAADRTKDYESMVRGVEMVYGELLEVLKREGLERIDSLHKPFDPELHEAVMHAEGQGDEIVVLDEMRPGYKLGGRVIRPAMVKVGSRQQ